MFLAFMLAAVSALPPSVSSLPPSVYAPLELYDGSWQVTPGFVKGNKSDSLVNHCARVDRFYACEQVVNGEPSAFIVFTPLDNAGHYHTQPISMEGKAQPYGDLTIQGDHWTYLGVAEDDGKKTYYRTTNLFTGKDRIHFESAKSSDNEHWEITASGDEVRLPSAN